MPYLASSKVRKRPLGPAWCRYVSYACDLNIRTGLLTPMTTISRLSSEFSEFSGQSGLTESLGSGGARDGKIRRSLAALEVSWKTGIL